MQEDEKEDTQVDGEADNINPAVKGKEGPTLAAKTIERHKKIAKMLIDHGADVNGVDDVSFNVHIKQQCNQLTRWVISKDGLSCALLVMTREII